MAFPYTEAESIAFVYKDKEVHDTIYKGNWIYKRAIEQGRVLHPDGRQVEIPVQYQKSRVTNTSGDLEVIEPAKKQLINMATFALKWKVVDAALTDEDIRSATSAGKVVDIVRFKVKDMSEALRDGLGDDFYSATAEGNLQMSGLRLAVDTGNTYGTIPQSAANSWWQAAGEDSTSTTITRDLLTTAYGACYDNTKEAPTCAVTTQTIFNAISNLFQPQQRYMGDGAKVGWGLSLPFNDIVIVPDNKCPASHLFFLNERQMWVYVDKNFNFDLVPWKQPINQPHASAAFLKWCGQLVVLPRYHYKFSAITG